MSKKTEIDAIRALLSETKAIFRVIGDSIITSKNQPEAEEAIQLALTTVREIVDSLVNAAGTRVVDLDFMGMSMERDRDGYGIMCVPGEAPKDREWEDSGCSWQDSGCVE